MLSFRETLRRYVPPWLSDRPGLSVGFRFLYALAAICDGGMQWLVEGIRARFPEVATPTALPLLGRDRRIIRGPEETDAGYATRLIPWLDVWRVAGSAEALTSQLQAFLFPGHPMVRIVTRGGLWHTLTPGAAVQVVQSQPNNWDWDSLTHPENATRWGDFWIIVYEPHYPTDGRWGDGTSFWGEDKVFGQNTSKANAAALRALVKQWKPAGTRCVNIIFAYNASSFDPAAAPGAAGMPDGRWGFWSKLDGSGNKVRSRRADARYWEV